MHTRINRLPTPFLTQELIARVFANLEFGKGKLRLQLVCKTWRDAMQLSAAHPQATFRRLHGKSLDVAAAYRLRSDRLDRVTELDLNLPYFRQLHPCPDLPNLTTLNLASGDHSPIPISLPNMQKLRHLSLDTSNQSGQGLMRTGLRELSTLRRFKYSSDYSADEVVPVIHVPPACNIMIYMSEVLCRQAIPVPMSTSTNITRLELEIENDLPDLRNCERLRFVTFWLTDPDAPEEHLRFMPGIERMPHSVDVLTLVANEKVFTEDRPGFCQFRFEHFIYEWCTQIISIERVTAAMLLGEHLDTLH